MTATAWLPPFDNSLVEHGRKLAEHGTLIIIGPPGTGRLILARRIAEPGSVLIHRGTLASASSPYYALRRLKPNLGIVGDESPADLALKLDGLRPEGSDPVTVILIGADLCDHASFSTLIERATIGGIQLIATIRPEALAHHPLLGTAPRIELSALDHAGIAHLLQQRFDVEPDPVVVEFVHARSQGAYDAVIEVTESALALGLLAVVEDTVTLMAETGDPPLLPAVGLSPGSFPLHDLLEVSPALTDLLQIVALVDEVDVHELMAALPGAPLDLALSHGVLKEVDEVVSFVVAAEAAAVDASLTLARRMELHDQYSAVFPHTFERPRAAMRAALCRRKVRRPVEPELAVRAARQANLEGLYREAILITEPTSPDEHPSAPMERAFALVELGRTAELITLLEHVTPGALTEEELTDFILLRWTYLTHGLGDDSDVLVGDTASVRRRSAVLHLAQLWAVSFQRSSPELETEIRTLLFSGSLSPLNTATGYLVLSTCQRHGGRSSQAAESARTALNLLRDNPIANAYVLEPAYEILLIALLDTLDFPAVEEVLVEYSSRPAPHGRAARMGHALWGLLEHRRGRIGLALTHAQLCLASLEKTDPQEIRGWVRAMTIELLAQHGRLDEVESMLTRPDVGPTSRRLQHDLERRTAEASSYDAVGRLDEAITILQGVVVEARATGLSKAEIDAAAMLVQIAGPPMLLQLKRAVDRVEDPTGIPAVWSRFVAAVESENVNGLFLLAGHLAGLKAAALAAEIARFTLDFADASGPDLTNGERLLLERVAYADGHPLATR